MPLAIIINHCKLKVIGALAKGHKISDVQQRLTGITCGNKMTSCSDQENLIEIQLFGISEQLLLMGKSTLFLTTIWI